MKRICNEGGMWARVQQPGAEKPIGITSVGGGEKSFFIFGVYVYFVGEMPKN